jgi:transposase
MGKNDAKGVYLSFEEQRRLDIANQVIQGQISIEKAALLLNKSERQTRRIVKAVEMKGVIGVKHGNTGKPPVNKTDDANKRLILDLLREKYFDFNLTHFIEHIEKKHQLKVGHETLRIWAHKEGLVK